jgi:hypothetical protein
MGTLSEWLADAVGCGSKSADKIFDVRRSLCSVRHSAHTAPIIHKSLMTSPAIGADIFRDGATFATSL